MANKVDVLDKGYVRLRDVMGSDLTVANAARVSYDKRTEELSSKDEGLIRFLAREGHTSPFRHAYIQYEVYAPLMVARQWFKYTTGSSHQENNWNESSRRYITEDEEFYVPNTDEWRSKPDNSKQGSGDPVDVELGGYYTKELERLRIQSEKLYNDAMEDGIAPEQARLFLPAYGMYVRWIWTASLQSIAHFIGERTASDAQWEIRQYADVVAEMAEEQFPVSIRELTKEDD